MGVLRRFSSSYKCQEDGSTSMEFSILVIPYLILSLGIIELAVMFAYGALLEGATGSAARMIRTGQIQQAQNIDPREMFVDAVCDYASVLTSCEETVGVEVMTMASFMDFENLRPQFDEDGNFVEQGFNAGASSDRVLVRVVYNYQYMTPFIGDLLGGADGAQTFVSTIVLQTEPYEFEGV